jgi:hypothetical protein
MKQPKRAIYSMLYFMVIVPIYSFTYRINNLYSITHKLYNNQQKNEYYKEIYCKEIINNNQHEIEYYIEFADNYYKSMYNQQNDNQQNDNQQNDNQQNDNQQNDENIIEKLDYYYNSMYNNNPTITLYNI